MPDPVTSTVVNLAVPPIREALSASENPLQWVIDICTLACRRCCAAWLRRSGR